MKRLVYAVVVAAAFAAAAMLNTMAIIVECGWWAWPFCQ